MTFDVADRQRQSGALQKARGFTQRNERRDAQIGAAANLGAGRWQILTRILLPMSVPGIIGGVAIVFPLAASTYVTASLLGGTSKPVLGTELYKQALVNIDFGSASAVGLILFAIILIVIVLIGILTRTTDRRARKA